MNNVKQIEKDMTVIDINTEAIVPIDIIYECFSSPK